MQAQKGQQPRLDQPFPLGASLACQGPPMVAPDKLGQLQVRGKVSQHAPSHIQHLKTRLQLQQTLAVDELIVYAYKLALNELILYDEKRSCR